MADETILDQRLEALERAVADLQLRLANMLVTDNWLEKVVGSISDESAFLQCLEFGRAYRHNSGLSLRRWWEGFLGRVCLLNSDVEA